MFLDSLEATNPTLITEAINLQQSGQIPANSYVIDLDALASNAEIIIGKAHDAGLLVYPMTKQIGRNPKAIQTLIAAGADGFVAVDMACARAIVAAGGTIGNLGHLVQVARHEIAEGLSMTPEFWTIFSLTQAQQISARATRPQKVLMRIFGAGDSYVESHAGGFALDNLPNDFAALSALPNIEVAGVTTYPSASFERLPRVVQATSNVETMQKAVAFLDEQGIINPQINWPSEVTSASLDLCIDSGATQVEPGHAFTGTSPYQIFAPHPEKQAIVYLSEVSHLDRDDALYYEATSAHFFGGGLYECIGAVEHTHQAIVGRTSGNHTRVELTLPAKGVIDFYGRLDFAPEDDIRIGDSVIVCTRPQAFFTRAYVVPVQGISSGNPEVLGIWETNGFPAAAPPQLTQH